MDLDVVTAKVVSKLSFPVFVKPTAGGSSFGISKVKDAASLSDAIRFAFTEGTTAIIEQGVTGRELTCAAYRDEEGVKTLPVIEIVTENDYFDYDAKYNGRSQEICPAPIDDALSCEIRETTTKIYSLLGCAGVVRWTTYSAATDCIFLK